ncbi:MAG: dephospho-CoA kinase [Paludibacteraceae bacterium]|nr:dephospho-CoA kinase [Paludibacteraceae bacterium]
MIKLGIAGGIGSGKSVISRLLQVMGVPVYDCDSNAKRLQETSQEIKDAYIELLGAEAYLPGGKLNKTYIADKIFGDKDLLQKINNIVHPAVFKDFESWANEQDSLIVGMESALIMQSERARKVLDVICLVTAPTELRIERAMKRDNAPREKIVQRIANQADDDESSRYADFVIVNDDKCGLIHQTRVMISEMMK